MSISRTLQTWLQNYVDRKRLPSGDLILSGDLRIDSRRVQRGDVFIALAGSLRHGGDFARSAAARGAVCILSDVELSQIEAPVVTVPDLSSKLYALANGYYGVNWSKIAVVAVTGTNGKSSVASQVAYAAPRLGYGGCQIGTVAYAGPGYSEAARETTPHFVETLRLLARWQQASPALLLGIEASSHALDQGRLGALPVDVAVFTNLSHDHLDYHGSFENYRQAKHKLFQQPGGSKACAAVVPDQDPAKLAAEVAGRATTTFSAGAGDFSVVGKASSAGQMHIQIEGRVNAAWSIAAAGQFQALNSAATFAALLALGVEPGAAAKALGNWPGVAGRMELIVNEPFLAFVDYAHTPAALAAALQSAREYVQPGGRLHCVFGCGGDRDREKRPQMGATAEKLADRVYLTSDNPRSEDPAAIAAAVRAGLVRPEDVVLELDRARAIAQALNAMRPGDVLLVAGKGHETGQIFADKTIDFDDREELRKWRTL